MLEVQNLCRSFRGIPAIESVSFKVAPGEIVGFLGPGGAGKSTTVKIITGMLRANEGLPTLESVFAQFVQQQDTRSIAKETVAVIKLWHA